ncbi:glycosyltransferase family A protein [Flavobacterium sp. j3]|uniref:Glycosyltransferase family A protein n=1 Tax=Flavobacterium aureirubrum TaxID=3133147 RepID=A0ABU9N2M6_9FLAO
MFLVTIIIPCYNQGQFLQETLVSVYHQTYTDWECIIVNDGSPDSTEEIALDWCKKDSRFIYFKKENGGLSSARNAGLQLSKGDYIQFLDSDDLLAPDKLFFSVKLFDVDTTLDVVITDYNMLDIKNSQIKPPVYNISNVHFNFDTIVNQWDIDFTIPIHCALFKKSSMGNLQFNEILKAKEDWLFWIQFFKKSYNVTFINQQLVSYRLHEKSMTQSASYMVESQSLALVLIKEELSTAQYEAFLLKRLNFYKQKYLDNAFKYSNLKNSLTYRFALKVKSVFKNLGLLPIVKIILQKFRN